MTENKIGENLKKYIPLNRKERYYTGTVLPQIICYNNFQYFSRFTDLIKGFPKNLKINPDANFNNIIFMTEYSLNESYKDLNDRKKYIDVPLTKETPDLVVIITEPEKLLIIVEAKMYSYADFSTFKSQFKDQKKMVNCIKNNLGIEEKNIFHLALVPEKYFNSSNTDEFQILFWEEILKSFNDILNENYFYNILKVAISSFDILRSSSYAFSTYGKNMDDKLTGLEIMELHNSGKRFCVGRGEGVSGNKFMTDIHSGGWKIFPYEVKYDSVPINRNWFTSSQFVNTVIKNTSSEKADIDNGELEDDIDQWHFSHLGESFFKNIALLTAQNYSLDVPIKHVLIGKSGEPYNLIKLGRNINPNWCVIMENGEEKKYDSRSKKISPGLYNNNNCHRFDWTEIKKYFKTNI